jgi:pSer/pThr/pTyr-binding forkhead associated (FHA) protein
MSLPDGRAHRLRVGVNALGRFRENDLVLTPNHVSRRHCLILVHATGGCEMSDTASRNGTWVNRRRVARADLFPGDLLALCDQHFVLTWVGPDGQTLPAPVASDTALGGPLLPGS